MAKVRCNKCMTVWDETDLILEPDCIDRELTHTCPNCHTDSELMDLEIDDDGDNE